MILAAGKGTRMRPLSDLVAKPALPVLGRPVIVWLLEFLHAQGIREVAVNLHARPETIQSAVSRSAPPDMQIHYFHEKQPLGTGGGIAAAREFLSGSDPAIVLAGDLLLDLDLARLIAEHMESGAQGTLALRRDPERASTFGSIGLDPEGCVRRIAKRLDLGGEVDEGVFVGLRLFSPSAFGSLPQNHPTGSFEDLTDWLGPLIRQDSRTVRGRMLTLKALTWTPVGTPAEYLSANLDPPSVSYLAPTQRVFPNTQRLGKKADLVLGPGALLGEGAELRRCVVWENESVPQNFQAAGGVFAGGKFYPCEEETGGSAPREMQLNE